MAKKNMNKDICSKLVIKSCKIETIINSCKEIEHIEDTSNLIDSFLRDLKFYGIDNTSHWLRLYNNLTKAYSVKHEEIQKELYVSMNTKRIS